jgi:hypothetical protein
VFHVAFVGALAATVLALFLPGRHQTREVQDRLSAEYRQLDLG